jgi:serine phosphatase RsbU (regulator of sigma subunit)/streptogramin lyase
VYRYDPDDDKGLSHKSVLGFHEDKQGNIWIGTDGGGLNRFDPVKKTFTHYRHDPNDKNSLGFDVVKSICEDSRGNLIIGTWSHGLDVFNRQKGVFTHYFSRNQNGKNPSAVDVWALLKDSQDNIWVGTLGGGLNLFYPQKDTFQYFRHDPNDKTTISSKDVYVVFEDSENNLWIGTNGGGLNLFDRNKGRFYHYIVDPAKPNSLSSNDIRAIYEDSQGNLWIGTQGGGLNHFNKKDGTFKAYTTADGLPSNTVLGILEDSNGNLWLSTLKGLCKFNPQKNISKNYTVEDGLQDNEFTSTCCLKSKTGKMYFGGINGFNVFQPDNIRDNSNVPPVVLTDFQIFNESVSPDDENALLSKHISETEEITLSYKHSVFSFEFAAMNYTIKEKNKYAYMMEGFDADWNYVGTERKATYTNLDAGNYVFRVKASNNDGVWNEEGVAVKIKITPPPWKTWWAYSLYAIAIIGTILGYLRYKAIEHQKKIERERLNKEMEIAHRIQTSLVPVSPEHDELEITAIMKPAEEVGGDYYDIIIDKDDNLWFAIGDVSGHGVTPGLIMMMAQTSFNITVKNRKHLSPKDAIIQVNEMLCENVRERLHESHFMTMTFLKYLREGKFSYAGLHIDLVIYRAKDKKCELVETDGLYLAILPDISHIIKDHTFQLEIGDIMVLYTDGVIEAKNENDELLEPAGLMEIVERNAEKSVEEIRDAIVTDTLDWCHHKQKDDIALIVARRRE